MIEIILICVFGLIFGEILYLFLLPKKQLEQDGYFISKIFAMCAGFSIPLLAHAGFLVIIKMGDMTQFFINIVMSPAVRGGVGAIAIFGIVIVYFKLNEKLRKYIDKKREYK